MNKKKILVFGLVDNNLGDLAISETCTFLLKDICAKKGIDVEIKNSDMFSLFLNSNARFGKGRIKAFVLARSYEQKPETRKSIEDFLLSNERKGFFQKILRKLCSWSRYLKRKIISLKIWNMKRRGKVAYRAYEKMISGFDLVVFAGGGIRKYVYQDFWAPISIISNVCEKLGTPIAFNAVGVEGYDESNLFCKLIKNALNKDVIKKVSTRDDLKNLLKYVDDKTKCSLVGDPALWAKEVYKLSQPAEKKVIGIGIIRPKIFKRNNIEIEEGEVFSIYENIIAEIEKRGLAYQLFSNGVRGDDEFGKDLLKHLGKDSEKKLIKYSKNAQELAETINSYAGVIAGRLHANIIATSYGVPSVGLVWNNKLNLFGVQIGNPERFIAPENLHNAKQIVDTLQKAMKEGYNQEKINKLKNDAYQSLEQVVTAYLK